MAFSTDIRRELAKVACDKKCCAIAELCGALLASGGLSFRGFGRYGVYFAADSQETAQRYHGMLKRFFHCECALVAVETSKLGGQLRYTATPPDSEIPALLRALRLLDKSQPFGLRPVPAPETLRADCCKRAFLRGAFLAVGSTGNPEKAYHLEFSLPDEILADCVSSLLLSHSLPARTVSRKGRLIVYLKDGEHIAELLTLMGAHQALLAFQNLRIVKELRNEANRQVNCDSANVDKAIAAAQRQISIIETIDKKIGLASLPEPLYDIAELRLRFPDATLTELGAMATPAIGKSGVNARMRKLEALAEELVNPPGQSTNPGL